MSAADDRRRRLAALTPAQREWLRRRRPGAAADVVEYPLSFAQERFLVLQRLEPTSCEFDLTGAARLRGELDAEALRAALDALADRHPALRTVLRVDGGGPRQAALPRAGHVLPHPPEDLSTLPEDERERAVHERARAFHRVPFDLERGPLFRARLLRLGPREHVLLVSQHHAVSDGWSLGVLVRELPALYAAARRGAEPDLPPPPRPFGAFASEERARLSPERRAELLARRRAALAGAPSSLDLPRDRPRPPLLTHDGETLRFALDAPVATRLRALARAQGATPFVGALALWQAWLGRLCGTDDVVVGTSYANRDRPGTERVVGPFVATLVVRTRCEGTASLRTCVDRARAALRDAIRDAELPFEQLVEGLAVPRDPSRNPLFDVFVDRAVPYRHPPWPGLELEEIEFERGTSGFDLSLSIGERADADERADGPLPCALEVDTALFDRATIERLWRGFAAFAASAVERPDAPLAEHPLVGPDGARAIVALGRGRAPEGDATTPTHELVLAAAARTPEAVAVEWAGGALAYGALVARAARVARRLRELGAERDARVAAHLPRSADTVVAALASWLAGAAYMPLDPEDPPERTAWLLADSGARVLVTAGADAAARAALLAHAGERPPRVLDLVEEADALAALPPEPPQVRVAPRDLAHVFYTSGSTGRPKGVAVPHSALSNHVAWVRRAFRFGPDDKIHLRTPVTFDPHVWEIVHPLVAGARIVVAPPGAHRDPATLLAQAAEAGVTVLQAVPSMLRHWIESPAFARCRSLRHVICSGETLDRDVAGRFRRRAEEAGLRIELYNLYGPAEACIDAAWETVGADPGGRDSVPIGRPIDGALAVVVDERLRPVPLGAAGELVLGGAGLARGYLGRPELTAERFVEAELAPGVRERVYRTGDRARMLPDGRLEFLGRADGQVKLRGARVELGEVESALAREPGVREAAAAVVGSGDAARLVGYVAPTDPARVGDPALAAELRRALARRLPRALVPQAIVVLAALPRTASEKLDRAALPAPPPGAGHAGGEPPRDELEAALAEDAAALLGATRVGRDDDFFELGGSSLLAVRLAARARERFGVDVPLLPFFERPTVATLASEVRAALAGGERDGRVPRRDPTSPPRPTPAAERLLVLDRLEPGGVHYAVPGGLRLRGPLDAAALARALDALVARHAALRTTYAWRDGGFVGETRPPEPLGLAVEDVGGATVAEREERARARLSALAARPFDLTNGLTRGSLVRAALLRHAAEDHTLLLVQHHVATDGTSLGVLLAELGELYAAEREGRPAALPEVALDVHDVAAWLRARTAGERGAELERAWRAALAGAPPPLELPADRARPPLPSHRGRTLARRLAPDVSAAVRALARARGATPFAVLLAAFCETLRRLTGETDVVVGTAVAGRERPELERVVGLLANVVPVRVDVSGRPTFDELVRRAHAAAREAVARAELPFERIVAAAGAPRDPSRHALFGVSFDGLGPVEGAARLGDVEARELEHDPGTAKLDLSVAVQERDGVFDARLELATDLLGEATVDGWWRLYERLLAAAVAAPGEPVARLPRASAAERERLAALARGPRFAAEPRPVPALWSALVRADPGAPALFVPPLVAPSSDAPPGGASRVVPRAELDRAAAGVARALADAGVGRGDVVALALPRSPAQVAALLGAWRLGAAWAPVDPADPPARVRALLEATRARVVVAAAELPAAALPAGVTLLLAPALEPADEAPPAIAPAPRDVAYLMPTSGSTGARKLVRVPHEALAVLVRATVERFGLGPRDRALHRIPLGFDAALLELVAPLAAGAGVVLVPPAIDRDPAAVLELATRERATFTAGVPSWLRALLADGGRFARWTSLRLLVSGGEAPGPELGARFHALRARAGSAARLVNAYGPAEACVQVAAHECGPAEPPAVPIGAPLPGARVELVDEVGEPVPEGVVGEIVLSGPQVALGYTDASAEDHARFTTDADGARRFRTGDLARRRADGALVLVGRAGHEVKVRGRRVDPAEVEAALRAHPAVRDAVVTAERAPDGLAAGAARLVAHLEADAGIDVEAVRALAAERLPAALVPTAWRVVAELPRLAGGKPDRRALAAAAAEAAPAGTGAGEERAPADELEARVAALAAAVIGLPRAPLERDLFELGATSLGIVDLAARLALELGREVPPRRLLERPTVAAIAAALRAPDADGGEARAWRDAELDPRVRPRALGRRFDAPPRTVLLTGATGFLGGHVLRELLDRSGARVVALARARDAREARERVRRNLEGLGLRADDVPARVEALAADLAAPGLGLGADARAALGRRVDRVVHVGAAVDFLRGYEALAPANVEGVRALVELACEGGGVPLHFVSTLGVWLTPGARARASLAEDDLPADLAGPDDGYERTKQVAERLVRAAGARGLPVAVHRPGRVAGHSRTGAWAAGDAAGRVLVGCLALGLAPDLDALVDVTPVDHVAAAIAALALAEPPDGWTTHLVHPAPTPFRALFERAIARGRELRLAPLGEWLAAARAAAAADPAHPLAPVLALVARAGEAPLEERLVPDLALPPIERARTAARLEVLGIRPPPIDAALLDRWLERLAPPLPAAEAT